MINVRSTSLSNHHCSHQWQTSNIGNRKRRNPHLFSRKAWTTPSEPIYRPTISPRPLLPFAYVEVPPGKSIWVLSTTAPCWLPSALKNPPVIWPMWSRPLRYVRNDLAQHGPWHV